MPGGVTRQAFAGLAVGPETRWDAARWEALRVQVRLHAAGLSGPRFPGQGQCATCRGPAAGGFARCFQCALHAESAPGALADVVVPIAFALKGSSYARMLWEYKSARADERTARAARRVLRALLLVFLHDHGRCIWRSAAMPPPTHVSVVPSGRGRPGPPPMCRLALPCVALPEAPLQAAGAALPGERDLDPGRFRAAGRLAGAAVLLLDDTWTSGASAQSAVGALRAAGARHVAVVVLGRHLSPPAAARWAQPPVTGWDVPFRLGRCAVHEANSLVG